MSAFARLSEVVALAALALAIPGGATADDASPARVVSMNLCTDQLAMLLAAPGQLQSVSVIAADPLASPMAAEAGAYPANHGGAEEIFLLAPDLVLAGTWSDPAVVSMLRRLGIRVEQVPEPARLSEIPDRLREVGALLGRDDAAEDIVAAFEAGLDALRRSGDGPRAAFYYPNGYTLGTEGLSHDILTTAGFRHIAEERGQSFGAFMALEVLVTTAPDLIIRSALYPGASRSEEILGHPALEHLIATGHATQSGADWACGTPYVLRALEDLAATRAAIEAEAAP